ncbi:MAG: YdeI/OmpD-associated family protein [Chloroflexi bacterium]|nr:YdeI/OmpD-associated family protein [Chloroflexota bacterium]
MRFHTTILQADKNATGIQIPAEVVERLGAGKRPPVRVTINGYTYRNTVAVMGGVFMVGVSAEHRKGAGVAGGDEVDVDIELDTEPRTVTVPPDFQAALDSDSEAKRFFEGLSYSNKSRHVLAIEGAKTAETRQRRIDKAVSDLRAGKM